MGNLRIFHNGKIATNSKPYFAEAIAVENGKIASVGRNSEVLRLKTPDTETIDLRGQTVIPGLNDSHLHIIRGGLHYNLELRWDGVPSLADALRMLKEQAVRTPAPQWVRVVGGWNEFQFAERRLPTLEEINAVAPETPVFVLHLYDRCVVECGGSPRRGIYEGYTQSSRWRDSTRQAWKSDRHADRTAKRRNSLLHPRKRAAAVVRRSACLDTTLHA